MNHPRRIEATPDDGEDARVRGMVGIMEARIAQKASQPRLAEPVAGPKPSAWAPRGTCTTSDHLWPRPPFPAIIVAT